MDVDLSEFVAGLPKCELHVHLEDTLEPELKLALMETPLMPNRVWRALREAETART